MDISKLPFETQKSYCESIDIYHQIKDYEFKHKTEQEFIKNVSDIKEKYSKATNYEELNALFLK